MRGSVQKRKTGYTIVYDVAPKWDESEECLKRAQRWEKVPAPDTRKHAEVLLAERLNQLNRSEYLEPTKITFAEFSRLWMEKYARGEGQIRASTLNLYDGHFRNHLIPAFGSMELVKIDVEDIQGFKAVKTVAGLAPQTVKHLLRLTRQMLGHAIDWGYLRSNPCDKVRNPRIPRREMDFLTADEVGKFLQHVPERWYAFFLVAVTTGLRAGELIAMKWENLDWNRGQYFVKETWLRPRGGNASGVAEPKTDSSVAPVDLTPASLTALKAHRVRQQTEKLAIGGDYHDQGFIFATENGHALDSCNISRRIYHPILVKAGIRRIRFHDLRHTCASLMIAQNESPKYIQKQLRHSSIEMTFDRYGHLFPDANRDAVARLDNAIFPNRPPANLNASL